MTQVVVALLTAGGVLVVGWFLLSGRRVLSQTRVRRSAERRPSILDADDVRDADWIYGDRAARERRAPRTASESGEADQQIPTETLSAKGKAEAILRDAELRAAEILERAKRERESLLEEKLVAAERAAHEMNDKAEQEAAALVKNAELKAGEVLVEVERARARLEQEMQELGREQARVAAKHERLSKFLLAALEEIERASPNGSAKIGGLQELRDELQSTE